MRLGLGLGVKNSTFVGGYDSATSAFLAATGITSKTESDAINDLVVRLKGYNLWGKMRAIYPFVSDTYNLINYSENFSSWSSDGATNASDVTTAPNGTLTADTINDGAAVNRHINYQTFSGDLSLSRTLSVYAKQNALRYLVLSVTTPLDANFYSAIFDLQTGTVSATKVYGTGTINASIVNAGNGWYRCIISGTLTTGTGTFYPMVGTSDRPGFTGGLSANNIPIYPGTNLTLYVWGAQLEQSASATTYQPIATTSANRFVSQFKYNLKDARDLDAAYRLAFNGTWTYTKQGPQPNGSSGYANTFFNPTTAGMTATSAHLSSYLRTDSTGTKVDIGGSYNFFMAPRWAGFYNYPINRGNNVSGTSADSIGYFMATRTDNTRDRMFKNGINVSNYTSVAAGVDNQNVWIANSSGGGLFSDRQTAFATIGDGLTDQDAANLYTSIQIYQQDLSRAVGTPIVKVSDLSAQSYVAATQIQNTVYATAVDVFVKGMKAVGLWEKMKAVYPFVSDNINQFGYTEDFTYNAMWGQNRCTMASNVTTAPDGTMTADSFTTTSTTIECQLRASISSPYNNVTQTTSVYAKKSTANYFRIRNLSSGGNAWFNLTNGTIGTIQGGQTATMTSVGNGWYRCTLTGTKGVSATDLYDIGFTDTDGTQYPTTSVVGFLWGAQLELGSTATTYIPVASTVDNKFVQQFKYNLMSPLDADSSYRLAFNGGWTYSLQGALPNGANAYADTKLIPNSHLSIESNHMSFYSRTQANTYAIEMGCEAVTAKDLILYHGFLARKTIVDGAFGTNEASSNITNTLGYQIGSRTSLSNLKLYWNNSLLATNTATKTDGQNSISIIIGATNKTTIGGYSSKQAAFSTIGDGLNDSEASTLYTLVQNFQTTLNRQVP